MSSTYSDTTIAPGTAYTAINLRDEISWICNNTGYWVGLRSFDLTKRSEYWDATAKEAKGGPPWEYTDYIFKSRRILPGRSSLENEILQRYGQIERESLIYFIPYNVSIKEEDLLFRIYDETQKTIPTSAKIRKVYEVTMLEPKIDGDLIYHVAKVKIKTPMNDMTLHGYKNVEYIAV